MCVFSMSVADSCQYTITVPGKRSTLMSHHCHAIMLNPQEIDELLGQNLTQEDEDAIAEELESILLVRNTCL